MMFGDYYKNYSSPDNRETSGIGKKTTKTLAKKVLF